MEITMPATSPYVSVTEAAYLLGRTVKTVYLYRDQGRLKTEMVAGRRVFLRDSVEALAKELANKRQKGEGDDDGDE